MMRESSAPFVEHDVECFLCCEILPDVRLDLLREIAIVEDADLHVEDRGFLWARMCARAITHLDETFFRALDSSSVALELSGDHVIPDDPGRDVRHLPPKEVHWANDYARRSGNARERAIHVRFRRICSR